LTLKRSELKRTSFKPQAKPMSVPRTRRCAVKLCRAPFVPRSMTHRACGNDCAAELARIKREEDERKKAKIQSAVDKAKLDALRPRKWWLKKAKTALHAYIRARDEGMPCISCDTILLKLGRVGGDYDAGHFMSVGAHKNLEFVEGNIFGQCKHCNDYLKGNQIEYERRLRIRCGDAHVEALKSGNAIRKYTIADFQTIEAKYKAKLKLL
jgi:Bacteriophage Lambda NinG protein